MTDPPASSSASSPAPASAPAPPNASPWRHTLAVAVGATLANLLAYAFNAIMSRHLGVSGYGELAALLAVVLVASVPGTALQAVLARGISTGTRGHHPAAASVLVATGVTCLLLVATPAVETFLGITSVVAVLWTALSLWPTTVAFGWQGVLQGSGRYRALAVLLVLIQVARVLGAVASAVTGGSYVEALAVGTAATVAVVALWAPAVLRGASGTRKRRRALIGDVVRDTSPILGVLVLSNLDLLLARHYLSPHEAGLYSAGNLVARAAFWGPAFVVLVSYPRLAIPEQREDALRRGVRMLALISAIGLVMAVFAAGLVPALLGNAYRPITTNVWMFAASGLALVGVQFAVFAGLAVADRRLGRLVWLTAAVEIAVVSATMHSSVIEIIGIALGCQLVLLLLAAAVEVRRSRSEPALVNPGVGQG